jgi:hypothetical protein
MFSTGLVLDHEVRSMRRWARADGTFSDPIFPPSMNAEAAAVS